MSPRDTLVDRYQPLAARLARRYRHGSESLEDLEQVAYLGLILAADRYSPERGTSFPTFAVPTILGELRRHLRDHGWAIRVPRGLQENVLRVTKALDELNVTLGRPPNADDVAGYTGLDVVDVLEAMEAATAYSTDSLDRPAPGDEGEQRDTVLALVGGVDPRYELVETAVSLQPAVAELSEAEQAVLAMRFLEDLTQSEIASRMGVSQMQISRMLRRSLDRLRTDERVAA